MDVAISAMNRNLHQIIWTITQQNDQSSICEGKWSIIYKRARGRAVTEVARRWVDREPGRQGFKRIEGNGRCYFAA